MVFFKFVIYCFLSLLLILEHQPLKLSGVYFRCRLIIVQPKAIFLYVFNVCFSCNDYSQSQGLYCVHILMTSSFSVESITKKCLLELPYHQMLQYNTCFLLLINIYLVLHHIFIFFVVLLENDYAFAQHFFVICLQHFVQYVYKKSRY